MIRGQTSVFIDRDVKGYTIGLAMYEPNGVKGWMSEIRSDPSHPYGAIDHLMHLLFVTNSNHLLVGATSKKIFDEIAANFSMFEVVFSDLKFDTDRQNALFHSRFKLQSLLSPIEHLNLESRPLCAQALALLAHHHTDETMTFSLPKLMDSFELMELGNNALEQLEMVNPDPKVPSIINMLLSMQTPMGKRLGRFRLFLPIRDAEEINRRLDWIERINAHAQWFNERLSCVQELELIWWQLQNGTISENERFQEEIQTIIDMQSYCLKHSLKELLPKQTLLDGWEIQYKNNGHSKQWLHTQSELMHETIDWIAQIDVAVSSALNARKFGLTRPVVVDAKGDNFLQISGLRHLLVEQQGIAYVPNDIVMGNRDYLDLPYPDTVMLDSKVHDGADIRGVLLYGINSSGKSSLMKSIGIAAILAQSGFFVPAKVMKFALFDGVYTRIQSRDNVAKSLSTFGVEMLELNTIFTRATPHSLILGDEISHGTETLSAVAIVASTIMELSQKGALFLMTTHLHQLSMISELSRLREVVHLHLSVRFDEEKDSLVYDRILKAGRGSSVYGLEFAESLHMNPSFLNNAKRLRENLAKEYDVLELGNQKEYIKRYREVVACECVVCGALVRNTQKNLHLKEHHHLIPLCETHAREITQGKIKPRGFIITPQGLRLEYEKQLV